MGFPIPHVFKFNKNNSTYIKTLVRYNSMISVEKINDIVLTDGFISSYKIKDLERLLAEKGEGRPDEVILTCRSWVCSSAYRTLPLLKEMLPTPVQTQDENVIKQIRMTESYLRGVMTPINQPRSEVYHVPPKPNFESPEEVHALLSRLNERNPNNVRALHIPTEKAFLIQQDDQTCLLYYGYGDAPGATLGQPYLGFDVDDGFINIMGNVPQGILQFLNDIFKPWKANHYQGELFSKENYDYALNRSTLIDQWIEHDFDEEYFPEGMVDSEELEGRINSYKRKLTQLEDDIKKIETSAREDLKGTEDESSEEKYQELLNANEDYKTYKKLFTIEVPLWIQRLEGSLAALQEQEAGNESGASDTEPDEPIPSENDSLAPVEGSESSSAKIARLLNIVPEVQPAVVQQQSAAAAAVDEPAQAQLQDEPMLDNEDQPGQSSPPRRAAM